WCFWISASPSLHFPSPWFSRPLTSTGFGLDASFLTVVSVFSWPPPLIAKAAMPRTTTRPPPMAIIMVELDLAACLGTGRELLCFATERVEDPDERARPVPGAGACCLGTAPVAGRAAGFGAGTLTAGWLSRVEGRPGRCIAMLDPFRWGRAGLFRLHDAFLEDQVLFH